MKLKKISTLLLTTGIMTLSSVAFAFANSAEVSVVPDYIDETISLDDSASIEQVLNKTISKNLSSTSFTPIVSDNNWLNARVYITLESSSDVSGATIYVSSSNGSTIMDEVYLGKGKSTYFEIPWNGGTWQLHAKAYGASGSATFHVQD